MPEDRKRGETLHREFVGMLFALVIAQVAIRAAEFVNHGLDLRTQAPAFAHLLLATLVIATSWVGWGQSKSSLSNVKHVFTWDFVELLLDVWLVVVYFFIVQGVEEVVSGRSNEASVENEARWVLTMFGTYVVWDLWTKRNDWSAIRERLWASVACAIAAVVSYLVLRHVYGVAAVILGDLSLIALVLLFRAMKVENLSAHTRQTWKRIAVLAIAWLGFGLTARYL
jgi:hypothetical protein